MSDEQVAAYLTYLHGYICELAKRTDISAVPLSPEAFLAAPHATEGT